MRSSSATSWSWTSIPSPRSAASIGSSRASCAKWHTSRMAKRDRRAKHVAAARYFESLGEDELAGVLASHYLAAYRASPSGDEADALAAQARVALTRGRRPGHRAACARRRARLPRTGARGDQRSHRAGGAPRARSRGCRHRWRGRRSVTSTRAKAGDLYAALRRSPGRAAQPHGAGARPCSLSTGTSCRRYSLQEALADVADLPPAPRDRRGAGGAGSAL